MADPDDEPLFKMLVSGSLVSSLQTDAMTNEVSIGHVVIGRTNHLNTSKVLLWTTGLAIFMVGGLQLSSQ
jgi:hypothetical protein